MRHMRPDGPRAQAPSPKKMTRRVTENRGRGTGKECGKGGKRTIARAGKACLLALAAAVCATAMASSPKTDGARYAYEAHDNSHTPDADKSAKPGEPDNPKKKQGGKKNDVIEVTIPIPSLASFLQGWESELSILSATDYPIPTGREADEYGLQMDNTEWVYSQPTESNVGNLPLDSTGVETCTRLFNKLMQNREIYNAYNDSITLIHNRRQWMGLFARRAEVFHDMYAENRTIINSMKRFIEADSAMSDGVRTYAYKSMLEVLYKGNQDESGDPYFTLGMSRYVMRYYQSGQCPDSLNNIAFLCNVLAESYYNISIMSGDTSTLRLAYNTFLRPASGMYDHLPGGMRARVIANHNLLFSQWVAKGMCGPTCFRRRAAEQDSLLRLPKIQAIFSQKDLNEFRKSVAINEERLTRNYYMADTTAANKHIRDSLMTTVVARNLANPNLPPRSMVHTLVMQVQLGLINASNAFYRAMEIRKEENAKYTDERIGDEQFAQRTIPYLDFFYLNDLASFGPAEKRANSRMLWDDIVNLFHHRRDCQASNYYINNLTKFIFYNRAMRYLSDSEKIHYMDEMMVAVQVPTYAHSIHVSEIADAIIRSVIRNKPDLLVGVLGLKDEKAVRRAHKELEDFMRHASLYHDLGKNSISPIVTNDYRPLNEAERDLIKLHPALGLRYLTVAPQLAKYHDTTLGHHKWYNGEGGYPEYFDNTKSPIRPLIDILTISDCLQAATEKVGRNYKSTNTLNSMMDEFRKGAGWRWNPEIISIIEADQRLRSELQDLVSNGWAEIYWKIYGEYFQ